MYVCICATTAKPEFGSATKNGAYSKETLGDTCGASTGCGNCQNAGDDPVATLPF
ncbi:hypothetical protein [Sphaerisporangium sp. NPDC051011]|uniref:(2Fe-2S)-binding protein n=1 Tax=Sphaerisporangium sp. NPDC051011 TaxID=3155792 RepID=UPI0033C42FFE